MKETERLVNELVAKAEEYGHSSLELVKLKSVKVSAKTTGMIGTQFILGTVIVLFLITLSMGVSFWLGDILDSVYLGFLCVAGFYLLLTIVLYIFRDSLIQRPIENGIIKNLLK
jgi:hypothetical protein